jgi:hypothetical protein
MGFKIKNTLFCAKMQVLVSRGNFGQGFRRGRRKMGFKNKKKKAPILGEKCKS